MEKNLGTWSKRLRWLSVILGAVLASVLPAIYFMQVPPLNDGGTFIAIADMMHQGAGLYSQVWDNKAPGIFFLHALFQFFAEPVSAAIALRICFVLLLHLSLFYLIATSLRRALLLLFFTPIFWNIVFNTTNFYSGDYTEFYGMVCILMSLLPLFSVQAKHWKAIIAGSFCALAVLIKEPFIFLAGIVFIYTLHTYWSHKKRILFFLLGACTPLFLFCVYLTIHKAWPHYLGYLSFAMEYSGRATPVDARQFLLRNYQEILVKFPAFTFGIIIAALSCLDRKWLKQYRNLPLVLYGLLATSMLFVYLGQQPYDHYLLPFLMPSSFFVLLGFQWLLWRLPEQLQHAKALKVARIALLLCLLFLSYTPVSQGFSQFYNEKYRVQLTAKQEKETFLGKISPNERLYVEHEGVGRFYTYTQSKVIWKYPCPYPVFFGTVSPTPSEMQRRNELVRAFTQSPPDAVLSRTHYGPAFAYAKLWDYIYAHYTEADSFTSCEGETLVIWRKKRSTP